MKKITIAVLIMSVVITSCKKNTVTTTQPVDSITENYNPPSNNSNIIDQYSTNASTYNSIYSMIPATVNASENNIVYYGNESSESGKRNYVLKKQSVTSNVIWSKSLNMIPYSIKNIFSINWGNIGDTYILIGGKDNNGDGIIENACISTFDKNGIEIATKINADPNYNTCFITSIQNSDNGCDTVRIYAMGYALKNNIYYPFIKEYYIDINGLIYEGMPCGDIPITEGVDINQPNKYFSGSTNDYYLTLKGTGTNLSQSYLQKVDISNVYNPIWEKQILGKIGTNDIITDASQNYYICGSEDDNTVPVGTNNYVWQNAILYKFNSTGNQLWKTVVKCSDNDKNYDDFFNDLSFNVTNNSIYCVGSHSSFSSKEGVFFGNGLISRINCSTGNIEYSYSLGDKTYRSSFNSVTWLGSNIYSGGFTNYKNATNGMKNWLVKTNF